CLVTLPKRKILLSHLPGDLFLPLRLPLVTVVILHVLLLAAIAKLVADEVAKALRNDRANKNAGGARGQNQNN
nr:hypothetical protein [Tanacetum cinerariifolium]